jgi:hypothetical protein
MAKDFIGYDNLVDRALRGVVRDALTRIQKQGLIGSHHFYITFKTHDPGVEIPDFLRERYPDEMTIVLQNQFSGLRVTDELFEVTLSFQKLPCTLVVPLPAVTGFADPSVQFGLQFKNASAAQQPGQPPSEVSKAAKPPAKNKGSLPAPAPSESGPADEKSGESPQIVSLDKFRKK